MSKIKEVRLSTVLVWSFSSKTRTTLSSLLFTFMQLVISVKAQTVLNLSSNIDFSLRWYIVVYHLFAGKIMVLRSVSIVREVGVPRTPTLAPSLPRGWMSLGQHEPPKYVQRSESTGLLEHSILNLSGKMLPPFVSSLDVVDRVPVGRPLPLRS